MLRVVQRALCGKTLKTRGWKRAWSAAAGEMEIRWKDIISKARVPKINASTTPRHFKKAGVKVVALAMPVLGKASLCQGLPACGQSGGLVRPGPWFT